MAQLTIKDEQELKKGLKEKDMAKMSHKQLWLYMREQLLKQEMPKKTEELLQSILIILNKIYMEILRKR